MTEWRWADFDGESGFSGRRVTGMVEVGDTLWVRSHEGVFWYAGFHWWRVGEEGGLPEGVPNALSPMGDGTMVVAVDGRVFRGTTESFQPFSPPEWDRDRFFVQSLAPLPEGVLVIAYDTRKHQEGLFHWGARGVHELEPPGSLGSSIGLWSFRGGSVLLSASRGLFRYREGEWLPVVAGGEEGYRFSGVSEGPDGSGFASQMTPLSDRGLYLWDRDGRIRHLPGPPPVSLPFFPTPWGERWWGPGLSPTWVSSRSIPMEP